ncbi:hypothetical protein GCM10023093_10830 [Nemorincola caseinilytica]|uniref:Ig-like domain-containing protein n=2 Tax=Nemorincola caseinilytica TaxID=2054315 RepID=A0ABP8N8D9_9BACT
MVCGLMLVASLAAPVRGLAAIGFSGGNITPTPQLVCSGSVGSFTFTPTTCSLPVGADWTADYAIDSFDFVTLNWLTPAFGTVSGSISAASPTVVYTTDVLISSACYQLRYRVRLTNITQPCIPGTTAFNSGDAVLNVCPAADPITGPSAVCVNGTITLATTSTGGAWSSSASGIASVGTDGVVTGHVAGTADIIYTLPGGCTAIHPVTVNANPTAVTGPTVACQGTTATYTLAGGPVPGTWSSTDPTVGTIDVATGVYTASATNSGLSTITFTNASGCTSSLAITINPFPNAIGCNTAMCFGDSINLCSTTPGGVWTSGDPSVITMVDPATGRITPTSPTAGTATVSYTVGGCSVTTIATATAAPSSIVGPTVVCEGATITLTGNPGGGTWSTTTPAIFSVNPGTGDVLALAGSGGSTGTVVYHLGTCTLSATVSVNVSPTPIIGGPQLCVGQTVTFTSTPAGGFWTRTPIVGTLNITTGVFTPPSTVGTVTISYTLPGTGCRTTKVVTVGVAPDTITGPTIVCQNSSITMCNATFGGDWGTITGGTGTATVNPVSAGCTSVTGTAPGTVIVTYALSATGCSTSKVITVDPAPTVITGPDYVCQGQTSNYSSSPGLGLWTIAPTTVATVTPATGVVTGVATGTATLTYTLPNGCSVSRVVTVATTPSTITGILAICVGQSTTLTSAPPGGTWMGTDTSVAFVDTLLGTVTGRSPGAIIVTRTLQPSGCNTTTVVTVNPLPPAITGSLQVCQFECTTLSNPIPGGTWSSLITGVATIGSSSGVACGHLPGTTTISYTFTSTGCSRTAVFTVNPQPLAIDGTLSVCVGSTTVLTNFSPGGPGTWTSGNPAVAPVNPTTGMVTGVSAGTANITYTLPTGCDTFATVTVNPLPAAITATNGIHTCVGSCKPLSNASPGGTWSSQDPSIATVHPSLGTLCGVNVGTTFITYTLPTGCITVSIATVQPTPPLPIGTDSVCVGSTVTFTHDTAGGTWSSGNLGVATVFLGTGVITGVSQGTANITYTTPIGCTTFRTLTVNPVPPAITGTLYMCVNNTSTLSNSMPGGTWVSGTTSIAVVGSSTGVVTGISAGTTLITYVMPTGCMATAVVTVYPLPVITGSVLVCPGVASTLNATPAGGLWTSSPTSIATIGSLTGVVMGVNPGTVNITYILASTCQAHVTATVQPLPAVITGPDQVCVGSDIQLFNFTGGGGTWSSSNPAIGSVGVTSGIVTGVSAGVVSITFTATTTGCVISKLVTVNPLPSAITGPSSVCVGSTITLGSTPPGGTWSVSGGHTSIVSGTGVLTGVSAGVDNITYTLPTGCIAVRSVTVDPLPAAIAGSLHVCFGNTATIYSGPAGGTWTWTNATGVINLTPLVAGSDTATITGITPGTATVTYTLPSGCEVTTTVTVDSLPGPITGLLNICVNDTTTLHSSSPGGTWSSDNVFIAVINGTSPTTGLLASVSAGTVTITYTLPTGCFITAVMTINPIPQPILGPLAICKDDVVTLSNVTTGGMWTSGNGAVATIGSASGTVTGIAPGTSVITYTLPSSCSRTAVLTVNPLPLPITGPLSICRGDTVVLTSATPGGTWSSGNPDTAFIFMPSGIMIGISPGPATITYTLPTGCKATTLVTVNPIPTAFNIAGSRVVCQGQSATLSHPTMPGGTWSATPTTVVTINATTGTYTGISGFGTATIRYVMPTGCDTFITVTVNPLPAAITGVLAVCVGNTSLLSSTTPGGTWSSSSPGVGTIDPNTGLFTAIAPTNTLITYRLTATGCAVTAVATVNPLPGTITGPASMCLDDTVVIGSTPTGGSWSFSPSGILNVIAIPPSFGTASVVGVSPGTATITYTLPTGCFRTSTFTVDSLPNPIVGPDTVCVGSTIILASTPSGSSGSGTWSFTSTPGGVISIAPFASHPDSATITGILPDTALVTFTNGHGCTAGHTVYVRPLPAGITGPTNVCVGFTITQASATGGGKWSISDTTILTVVASIDSVTGVVTAISPGTAMVTYKLPTSCYVTRIITVNPVPDVSIVSYPSLVCKYASVTVNATGAGTGGNYTWTPPTGLSATTGATVVASPTITTTYTVTGTTAAGCSDTAVVTVWIDSLLNDITITGQDSICMGDCTTLIAKGRESTYFEWRPSTGLSCTICDTVTACPTTTTVYNALAIDSLGCRDSLFFTVRVLPLPLMTVSPNPVIVCNGRSTQVNITDASGTAGTTFEWFPNAFLSCVVCPDPVISATSNLVYRVIGVTPFGCRDSIRIPVTVLDSAFNSINKDTVICEGASAQLYAISYNPDGSRSDFRWSPTTNMSDPTISNPVVTPIATTTYSVAITPNVCFPDTLYTTVVVVPAPEISITPKSSTVAPGTPVTLTASIDNQVVVSSFAWTDPATLSCYECFRTVATPSVTTTYTFTATSVYGCTSSATAVVNVGCESSQIYIPNSFTPNGDGMNDRFYVQGKGIGKVTKFLIYGRWGQLVYEGYNLDVNDASRGWDGQYKDVMMPPGVYYYVVEATCSLNGTLFTYQGDVTIVK